MKNLSEIVKLWPVADGWRVAPEGVDFCTKGTRISVIGEGAHIGAGARIGEWAIIGAGASISERARIGAWSIIGEGAHIGAGARIGEWVYIGAGASISEQASIGEGAIIGANSTGAVDIGFADGYRKCIAEVEGVAYIGAGCRWFTLDAAIKHWGALPVGVCDMTICLLESAQAIARIKRWRFL